MKKIWICLLCLLLTVSAAACGGTGGESYASAEPSISEAESLPEASGSPDVSEISGSESFAASEAVSDSHNSETVEARTPSARYDALMERVNAGNIYIEMAGNLFGVETEFAVAEGDGVVTTRQTIEGETTYTMVRDGKSYVFDLLSPYYYVTEEETAADEMRFLSEGSEELNGKVYDFVLCEMPEDETQKLTFLLEGEALYAIRITIQMGDSTMQALLTVTAFTEEIPDDIPFELPKGYMEYTYEPYEEIEFPSALPPFDAGTLYSTSSAAGQNAFVYIFTEQTDCSAYIEALKAAGFRQIDWKEQGVFAATKDGIIVTVCYSAGATLIASVLPSDVILDERIEFPSHLPAFDAGTLYYAAADTDIYTFGYMYTSQEDYDAYVQMLTDAGFEPQESETENMFTGVDDSGKVITVYHVAGITSIHCTTSWSAL